MLACHIPACRSDLHQKMNITKTCNLMTLIHLVRIRAKLFQKISLDGIKLCGKYRYLREAVRDRVK